jgi:hypothetical protein
VAAEKVELSYQNHPLISDIFLHGEPSSSYAVVFVSPDKARL